MFNKESEYSYWDRIYFCFNDFFIFFICDFSRNYGLIIKRELSIKYETYYNIDLIIDNNSYEVKLGNHKKIKENVIIYIVV